MRAVPIVTYLDTQRRMEDRARAGLEDQKSIAQADGPDVAGLIEEARARAYSAGYEAGKSEALSSAISEIEASGECNIPEARLQYQEQIDIFKGSLERELARYRRDLESNLSIIMRSLLEKSIFLRNKNEITRTIRSLVEISGSATITVTGSKILNEALRQKFSSSLSKIRFIENDETPDVTIETDQTLISSKIENWRKRIDTLFLAES